MSEVRKQKLVTLVNIDGNFVPKWFEGTPIGEEHPKYTYVGKFHVGASVEIGNEKQRINRITRRKFKNNVVHEVLECQDVVVLLAYDWEKVKPYAADVEKLRRFFSPSITDMYQRDMYDSARDGSMSDDMLFTWQPIKKFPNGAKINIVPILFVKNGILEDFINMEEFQIMVDEAPVIHLGGGTHETAIDDGVVQS